MRRIAMLVVVAAFVALSPHSASAGGPDLDRAAAAALKRLYTTQPVAKALGARAKAILVFPTMVKAGFMFGGQIGEGVLLKKGRPATTTRSPRPTASRRASRPSATRCSP